MSAFVVSRTVIDVATAVLIAHEKRPSDADAIGRALWSMNVEAVAQRYSLRYRRGGPAQLAEYVAMVSTYRFRPVRDLSAAAICKQIDCLLYQCLEADVPERDPNFPRLEAVSAALAEPLGGDARHDHPDYVRAPWGLPQDAAS
ncbi:MAG: hypothetical protein AAGH68_02300 [Pseudomonadota bacterium]